MNLSSLLHHVNAYVFRRLKQEGTTLGLTQLHTFYIIFKFTSNSIYNN